VIKFVCECGSVAVTTRYRARTRIVAVQFEKDPPIAFLSDLPKGWIMEFIDAEKVHELRCPDCVRTRGIAVPSGDGAV